MQKLATQSWLTFSQGAGRSGNPKAIQSNLDGASVELCAFLARTRMCVRVPPHLGHPGDEAAVTMLALNPDRRVVVDSDGTTWFLWPVHQEKETAPANLAATRTVRALGNGGRPRTLSLPEGLALGQLTDQEILDLLD